MHLARIAAAGLNNAEAAESDEAQSRFVSVHAHSTSRRAAGQTAYGRPKCVAEFTVSVLHLRG
jgi:hypothetical protein